MAEDTTPSLRTVDRFDFAPKSERCGRWSESTTNQSLTVDIYNKTGVILLRARPGGRALRNTDCWGLRDALINDLGVPINLLPVDLCTSPQGMIPSETVYLPRSLKSHSGLEA